MKTQRKVENHHFEMRKQGPEFDDVMNRQREVIYETRRKVLYGRGHQGTDPGDDRRACQSLVDAFCDEKIYPEEWDLEGLVHRFTEIFAGEAQVDACRACRKNREEVAAEFWSSGPTKPTTSGRKQIGPKPCGSRTLRHAPLHRSKVDGASAGHG